MQQTFNPINYGFKFTSDGWYTFDHAAATKAARTARDAAVRGLRKAGRTVKCFSCPNQLISRGGIGSGNPHIEEIVTVYGYNVLGG